MTTTDWLTLALVLITAVYAWATFRILKANEGVVAAMKEQTEAQTRPYVVITVSPRIGSTLLLLEVQNTGKTPALRLTMKWDRDFYFNGEKGRDNLAKLPAFTEVIESLAPGARLQFILGVGHVIFSPGVDDSVCPKLFSISAEYFSNERKFAEKSVLDLRPMLHTTAMYDPVAEEVKKLRESLEKVLGK